MGKSIDWNDIGAKIQKPYDLALSASDDFSFYINLVNYLSLFDQIPELQKFIKNNVNVAAKKDHSLLSKLEGKIIKETLTTFHKIEPYIDLHKINTPELQENAKKIGLVYEEKIISSNGKMKEMFGSLNRVLYIAWDLEDGKHKKFLKKFGKIDKEGNIHWKLTEKIEAYDVEEAKIKRIGLVKIWYYWDKLAFYYNLFMEYEKMIKDWFDQRRFMTMMGTKDAYVELAQPLGLLDRHQKETSHYFFEKKEMQNALRQFHYHFLSTLDLIKMKKDNKIHTKYDSKRKELTIDKRGIFFKGKRADLLETLFRENRKLYFDECLEHIEGISTTSCSSQELKSYKKRFVNYCNGINTRASACGYTDFLFSDSNSVKINPLYR